MTEKLLTPKYMVKSTTKEHIMDTPAPADNNSVFESFPNYHNFPSQWDLSELDAPSARNGHNGQAAQIPGATGTRTDDPLPVSEAYPVFSHESFPKLRTFPVYWDLSR
jgi:hypothetical protein